MHAGKWNFQKRETADDDDDWSVFFYNPSLPAAILFAGLYLIPLVYHLYVSYIAYRRGRYFRYSYTLPLLIAAAVEVIGYGQRAASTQNVQDIGTFATSLTLIVLAPVLVCASLYILLSRIIRSTSTEASGQCHDNQEKGDTRVLGGYLKAAWLPKIFITLDVGAMLTQGGGSAVASAGEWEEDSLGKAGKGILIAGLALQLATFSVFLVVVVKFHRDALKGGVLAQEEGMKRVLSGVYIAGFFIMVRSIFRVIEFAWGMDSYLMTHEWPVYVLEAVPMFIAFMVLGWYHPSRWLPSSAAGESKGRQWLKRHRRRNLPQQGESVSSV
ncbi:RTA1 domain-containing protein [Aspergillus puulaauensis]|uniref:RTA1 domain protein n=1 Tax=Aspergillus puulaauensis TaxID=1220207 RepID=A0A7R7XRN6_9EURO|nr:uncharacterized protein APUU_50255A [Aspergillus puulaauensis]BCS25544.1 hypothetical protein APUU_50255A [Aspergillus puulaauensis]